MPPNEAIDLWRCYSPRRAPPQSLLVHPEYDSAFIRRSGARRNMQRSVNLHWPREHCQGSGLKFRLEIRTDASAAVGICRRRGLGKIRHLATADLWVQDKVRSGAFVLSKIQGSDNPSDSLTKCVERPLLSKHIEALGLRLETGRAE